MNKTVKINFLDLIILILIFYISQFFSIFIYQIPTFFHWNISLFTPLIYIFSFVFTFMVFYFLILKPRKEKYIFRLKYRNIKYLPSLILFFAGNFILSEFLVELIPKEGNLFGELYKSMQNALLGNYSNNPMISILSICLLAPILEEFFFRGIILEGLLNNKINPILSIFISAILFGGVHFYPWQILGGFLAGWVLGWVYYITKSLSFTILLHFLNNLTGILIFHFFGNKDFKDVVEIPTFLLLIIGIILYATFGYLSLKKYKSIQWKYY